MKHKLSRLILICVCIAIIVSLVACGAPAATVTDRVGGTADGETEITHTYSTEWSYDQYTHWHICLEEGYTDLRGDEGAHIPGSEVILTPPTGTSTGLARYTCPVCGYVYEEVIPMTTEITEMPTVEAQTIYIGQPLSSIPLAGGAGSVAGSFAWTEPEERVTANGTYSVTFTPDNADYGTATGTVSLTAVQLTVEISAGENGVATPSGTVNIGYGDSLTVMFTPDLGYAVDELLLDGTAVDPVSRYTLPDITTPHTLSASFEESEMTVEITCSEGDPDCYSIAGNTITFTALTQDSVYTIAGGMVGNLVIDVGDDYRFELEMLNFSLSSDTVNPITVLSGDHVTLTAKKGYENFIYDLREAASEDDGTVYSAAIYSAVDLVIGGKGSLVVESENNNGIHSKNDLEVKNLILSVTCMDNALKGNDSVTVSGGTITLISKAGDGIKTTDSDVSGKGNQRGTVTLSACTMDIYAACDGIDAAYNIVIDDETTVLHIYTDKYSPYSEEVTAVSDSVYYIRFTSTAYSYSVRYYNSNADYLWENATYATSVSGNRSTYYYYSFPIRTDYAKVQFFIYSSAQQQGQDTDYVACTDYLTWNTAYDTFAISRSGTSLKYSWTNYTTQSSGMGGPGGMGGMIGGNSNKGDYSTKGLKADNEIFIYAGTIVIQSYDDAIHANSDNALENGETPTGNVTVSGGTLTLSTDDDGIHADGCLTVSGGTIEVTDSYEGLEGSSVVITGGNIAVVSKDDGINASATSGAGITIGGGTVYVYAGGDGLDANSRSSYNGIIFSGGQTVILCTSSGNSAIDTEAGYQYTGGSVVAIMPSGGMSGETTNCQNFSTVATRVTLSLSSGSYVTVTAGSQTLVTVRMPCSLSGTVIYLGSNAAGITSASSTSSTPDAHGVSWGE